MLLTVELDDDAFTVKGVVVCVIMSLVVMLEYVKLYPAGSRAVIIVIKVFTL
jgi:hypothetical protein